MHRSGLNKVSNNIHEHNSHVYLKKVCRLVITNTNMNNASGEILRTKSLKIFIHFTCSRVVPCFSGTKRHCALVIQYNKTTAGRQVM